MRAILEAVLRVLELAPTKQNCFICQVRSKNICCSTNEIQPPFLSTSLNVPVKNNRYRLLRAINDNVYYINGGNIKLQYNARSVVDINLCWQLQSPSLQKGRLEHCRIF